MASHIDEITGKIEYLQEVVDGRALPQERYLRSR
jgi:hypothetical protein